jgi:hypothetical protein
MTTINLPIPEEEVKAPQAKVLIDDEKQEDIPILEKTEGERSEEEEEAEPAVSTEEAAELMKQLSSAQGLEAKSAAAEKIGDFARIGKY